MALANLIYILDDEPDLRELVIHHLTKNGFEGRGFAKPQELLKTLKKELPALLILDLMLPEEDGLELCKRLKNDPQLKVIPIIILSARQEETDKVLGLELGADDYISKPFSPKELIARIKTVLRRHSSKNQTSAQLRLNCGLTIDLANYEVKSPQNKIIELTPLEFKILSKLALHPNQVLSRESLIAAIWGDNVFISERTIDVHIRHLREKLKEAGDLILSVRGVGYKLAD